MDSIANELVNANSIKATKLRQYMATTLQVKFHNYLFKVT